MTPKIRQNIIPRSHDATGRVQKRSWNTWSFNSKKESVRKIYQMGNSNHATVTIMFGVFAVIVVGLLGFIYLQQVVDTASQGTDIRGLENKIIEIREEQRVLELEGAQLRSIQAIEEKMDTLNLIPTDRVTFLAPTGDGKVATNGI